MLHADYIQRSHSCHQVEICLYFPQAFLFILFYNLCFTYFHLLHTKKIKYLMFILTLLSAKEGTEDNNLSKFFDEVKIPYTQ